MGPARSCGGKPVAGELAAPVGVAGTGLGEMAEIMETNRNGQDRAQATFLVIGWPLKLLGTLFR